MTIRYFKKRNTVENSTKTNTLNLETMQGYSFGWWRYVQLISNTNILFNNYSYSSCTGNHQADMNHFLSKSGISFKTVYWEAGLQNPSGQIRNFEFEIKELEIKINKPRTHKKKNEERRGTIRQLENDILEVKAFIIDKDKGLHDNPTHNFTFDFESIKPKKVVPYIHKSEFEYFIEEVDSMVKEVEGR